VRRIIEVTLEEKFGFGLKIFLDWFTKYAGSSWELSSGMLECYLRLQPDRVASGASRTDTILHITRSPDLQKIEEARTADFKDVSCVEHGKSVIKAAVCVLRVGFDEMM
jgi:hypothetical protein